MKFDILTTFPNGFSYLNESIIKRGKEKNLIEIEVHDLRKWAEDKHKVTDDAPFGGGAGMVMKVEPIYRALKELGVYPTRDAGTKVVLTSASGLKWNQKTANEFATNIKRLVIICGHYEGIDQRVADTMVDYEISIGEYVLSGGELASMVIVDSTARLIDGVLGNPESIVEETHTTYEKEHPHYTRPATFITDEGLELKVPDVLLSGDHKKIADWKIENSK